MRKWGGNYALRKRQQVLEVYGPVCWLCGQPIDGLPSADHVIPRSKGGTDDIENLRPSHGRRGDSRNCNAARGNRVPKRKVRVFGPTEW